MTCPACERNNPADARFCIYCSAQLTAPETVVQDVPTPAVGATTRLPEASVPAYTMPAPAPMPAPAVPHTAGHIRHFPHLNQASGAFFLIGLGVLFLTNSFWPGILVLIGVTAFLSEAGKGRANNALMPLVFFIGLAFLFGTGMIWPGILILLGIMALLGSKRGSCS
ncbi:MAG: zinc ribbon domain-containing protein [Chloroflexi bacterium]|nr:zinc ribbon domain-containing protein [Chloroflexota bacterium]